jgi:hypothetical protein
MNDAVVRASIVSGIVLAFLAVLVPAAQAQIRGLNTPGTTAMDSGVLPDTGLTYQELFQMFSFDELKGDKGQSLPGNEKAALFINDSIFVWVSKYKLLGGNYSASADLAVTNSSLTTVTFGKVAGAAGLADSYFSPLTLGWQKTRADLQAAYGFMAPTGRFTAGATDNTGSGYWGHFLTAGQTVYLTADKRTAVSAFEVYEFHTTQQTTDIHPGQTFGIDYSFTQVVPLDEDQHTLLQLGLIGYGQYQTTDRTGPTVDPRIAAATHFRVNALGVGANVLLPERKVVVGVSYFKEFSNASTVQGQSLQISGTVTF